MESRQTERQAASLQGRHGERERRSAQRQTGLRAAGATAAGLAAPIVARRGGGALVRLKSAWAEIAGEPYAALAWPETLGRDGALKLRTVPAAAVELQHRAPLLIDRINLYFGRPVVTRLVLVQAPLPLAGSGHRAPIEALPATEEAALDARLAAVPSAELREALAGLGRLVLSTTRPR